jgi:hypothetical protein
MDKMADESHRDPHIVNEVEPRDCENYACYFDSATSFGIIVEGTWINHVRCSRS